MELIGTATSPFVRKVRIVLALKKLPFEFVIDAPSQPGSRVPLFNPLGKIPVLVADGGETVYDSAVIVDYLEAIAPTPPLLPAAPLERVAVKRWEALADGLLDAGVAIMTERRRDASEQSPAWMRKQEGKLRQGLAAAAAQLGDRPWCHGTAAGLADIALVVALRYLDFRLPEIDWRAPYPNLARLHDALQTWPAFPATEPPPGS